MSAIKYYLAFYNAVLVFGWSIILVKSLSGISQGLSWAELYTSVETEVKIFQTAAVLEVVHSLLGFVRSPIGTTVMQVTSRVVLVWPILHSCATARHSIGVPMLLVAWSVTEVIRYSFYALGLFNAVPYVLTWMRYTFFYVLYPVGVSGELLTLFASLNEVHEKQLYSISMPNKVNMSLSFWWVLVITALTYIPGFPQLYFYMIAQRKKVLGVNSEKKRN
ncbi:unnamed protein product [Caenorhabditis auriculariae]|uniref:Very-long-chain (3R)-3-hydroxyacyl-CoA dehydratase n=1 Tax=Caenorhabditis auriculariae TaxID=2777116 RepID=A0A8S1HAY0_9PELO|nr:unnamed protein product [Caenorhabditis auriculariae]